MNPKIESLLSARLFLAPPRVGDRLFFVSNMSGHLSLYAMDANGSIPESLLPPDLALQNPKLIPGQLYYVLPKLGKILLMLDHDGNEHYDPNFIPIDGGYPEPIFGDHFKNNRVYCTRVDRETGHALFVADLLTEPKYVAYHADLNTATLTRLFESTHGIAALAEDQERIAIVEDYTIGDTVLYLWSKAEGIKTLYGTPLDERSTDQHYPLTRFGLGCEFIDNGKRLLIGTVLFEDTGSIGCLDLTDGHDLMPVKIDGLVHHGTGELVGFERARDDHFRLSDNIDGITWLYETTFDSAALSLHIEYVICGQGDLSSGVTAGECYDPLSDSYALAFSTATLPTQIVTVSGKNRAVQKMFTHERALGIPPEHLSKGEDASFTSHDGLRISARLYLPAASLGYDGARPLVYYVHGGPQGQERPTFAWFSIPLIQFLTLNGFAVFVPNVRGSTGYGLKYTKHVDHDWGGQDRLDHVHAMGLLAHDSRVDAARAAVIGRSYGGFMTLALASRHPDLWKAAVEMFGPANLVSFIDRVPETWKTYFRIAVGDPDTERDFLMQSSPMTYIDQVTCPMLVIQGRNDPRVIPAESEDVVNRLRARGRPVDYILFENEGHDVLKFENRVRCYTAITEFFKRYLIAEPIPQ